MTKGRSGENLIPVNLPGRATSSGRAEHTRRPHVDGLTRSVKSSPDAVRESGFELMKNTINTDKFLKIHTNKISMELYIYQIVARVY